MGAGPSIVEVECWVGGGGRGLRAVIVCCEERRFVRPER